MGFGESMDEGTQRKYHGLADLHTSWCSEVWVVVHSVLSSAVLDGWLLSPVDWDEFG